MLFAAKTKFLQSNCALNEKRNEAVAAIPPDRSFHCQRCLDAKTTTLHDTLSKELSTCVRKQWHNVFEQMHDEILFLQKYERNHYRQEWKVSTSSTQMIMVTSKTFSLHVFCTVVLNLWKQSSVYKYMTNRKFFFHWFPDREETRKQFERI